MAITANHDKVDRDFMMNLVTLEKPCEIVISLRGEHIKSASLNEHVTQASNHGCSHIFFMDVDMSFPPWTLYMLMSHNLPIVSGLYHLKSTPYSPIAGWVDSDGHAVNGNGRSWKEDYCPLPDNSLVQVDWCGIGCLLVDMDVFNKIWFPPFRDEWDVEEGKRHKGHDVIFCEEVRKAGYKIFVDTHTDLMHIGRSVVSKAWIETYHRCRMDEELLKTVKGYSQEPTWWDEKWMGSLAKPHEMGYRSLIKEFVARIPMRSSVIDMGCGDGSALRLLREMNACDVYGMDFSNTVMNILRKKKIPCEKVDLRNYSPNGRKADTVILSHVLEHMPDHDSAVRLVKTVSDMAIDQAFIVVPDEKELWYEHALRFDESSLRDITAPYFASVEISNIERDIVTQYDSHYHIMAHCRKSAASGSDEVSGAITG